MKGDEMKKTVIKLFSLVLAVSLFLVGCSSGNSGNSGNSSNSSNNTQEETTADDKVHIEYWHVNAETQGGKTVDELVDEFNKQSDTVEVTAVYNPDMYKGLMQNLQAEQAAGKSPAVVQVGWAFLDYFSNNFDYIAPQDAIDKYDSEDPDFLKDNFLPNILDLAVNLNGDQVGIPYSLSTPVLYINRDILRECDLDENGPETWEEVREFSKVIKEKTGKYGLYIQEPADFWGQQAILESNGANILTQEGDSVKASFASDEGIEAFEFYADMVNKDESALHTNWDQGVQSFIDGNVAMCYTTIARRASIQEGSSFDVATVKSPVFEGKERRIPAGGCFLAITAQDDKEIEAAWEFEKYLYSIESMAAWTIGTGYTPPREGVAEAENGLKDFLAENEMMEAAIAQTDSVVPWASFPGDSGLEAEQSLLDMRDEILGNQVPAEEAMKDTQEKINALLD